MLIIDGKEVIAVRQVFNILGERRRYPELRVQEQEDGEQAMLVRSEDNFFLCETLDKGQSVGDFKGDHFGMGDEEEEVVFAYESIGDDLAVARESLHKEYLGEKCTVSGQRL